MRLVRERSRLVRCCPRHSERRSFLPAQDQPGRELVMTNLANFLKLGSHLCDGCVTDIGRRRMRVPLSAPAAGCAVSPSGLSRPRRTATRPSPLACMTRQAAYRLSGPWRQVLGKPETSRLERMCDKGGPEAASPAARTRSACDRLSYMCSVSPAWLTGTDLGAGAAHIPSRNVVTGGLQEPPPRPAGRPLRPRARAARPTRRLPRARSGHATARDAEPPPSACQAVD